MRLRCQQANKQYSTFNVELLTFFGSHALFSIGIPARDLLPFIGTNNSKYYRSMGCLRDDCILAKLIVFLCLLAKIALKI